jgi:hypothetical protein
MKDKSKTFTWDWEDGETGEIRIIEIAMPDLIVTTIQANHERSFSIVS